MSTQPDLACGDPIDAMLRENPSSFRPGFRAWVKDNRHVWRAFCREADRAWARGRQHYSARTIIEYLRHETSMSESGCIFKIDGNCVPDMARLYRLINPDRAGLFEVRVMPGSVRAA